MTQKTSILGNDPFLRGAATRDPIGDSKSAEGDGGGAKPKVMSPPKKAPKNEKKARKVETKRSRSRASAKKSPPVDTAPHPVSWRPALRHRPSAGMPVDDFGLDPAVERRWRPRFDFIHDKWFRVETRGIENLPKEGSALLVCNHGGALPWDAVMIKTAIEKALGSERRVRPLVEDFIFHLPFLGTLLNRCGAVRACQENAERLLSMGSLLAVFPEGLMGLGKPYSSRYRLMRFGRGGFVKLAVRTGAPLIPVAIVGPEDSHPILFNPARLTGSLGLPYLPITPTFPLLGPLGILPLPAKWHIEIGEPIDLSSHGPRTALDKVLVTRLADQVRTEIQGRVDRLRSLRQGILG